MLSLITHRDEKGAAKYVHDNYWKVGLGTLYTSKLLSVRVIQWRERNLSKGTPIECKVINLQEASEEGHGIR